MSIHPTGELVATGSFDHTWRLWRLKRQGDDAIKPRLVHFNPDAHSDIVRFVLFTPDKRFLISGSDDGVLNVACVNVHLDQRIATVHRVFEGKGFNFVRRLSLDWRRSNIKLILEDNMRVMLEPNWRASQDDPGKTTNFTLVQSAAHEAIAGFLSTFLLVTPDDTVDEEIKGELRRRVYLISMYVANISAHNVTLPTPPSFLTLQNLLLCDSLRSTQETLVSLATNPRVGRVDRR